MTGQKDGLREQDGPEHATASVGQRLYERDRELGSGERAVERLCQRFESGGIEIGEMLLYSGKAGIGKTSVLDAVRRSARLRRQCTVLFARGGERQSNHPFHVLRQLLVPVLSELDPAERAEVFGGWYGIVGPAIGLVPPAEEVEQRDPQVVRDGLDYVLSQLAPRRAPLVMIVDDLHWADLESLSWLAAFAVRARELPVLLIFTYRDEFCDEAQPLRGHIESRATRRHELGTLNPESVARLVRMELGEGAEDAFCRQVWAVAAGIPYDTEALLRKVREHGLEPLEENGPQLHDLAAEAKGMRRKNWLDKLGPATLQFAWAAALLGTDIKWELAAEIATQGPDTAQESIRALRKHRIMTSTPNGRLEFVHPLIATSIYQSMPSAARRGMHGVAAAAIENAGGSLLESSRHLLETHPEGDDSVVRKLRRAAAEHLAIGAPEAAQRCLRRALAEPPDQADRAELLYELGCAALLTDPAATVNQLRLALDIEDGLSEEVRVNAIFRLAEVLAHSGDLIAASKVCREGAERTEPGHGRLRLTTAHLMYETFQQDEQDGPGRSQSFEELSGALTGDTDAARAVRALRAWDLTMRGEPAVGALRLTEQALESGRLPKELGWTNTTWNFELPAHIGLTFAYGDELARAEKLFSEAVLEFEVAGWGGGHRGFAYFLMGLVRFRRGLLLEAEDFLRRALRISDRIAPGIPLQWNTVGMLADTLLARGRVAEAWELAQKYDFAPPYHPTAVVIPDAATLYGKLLLATGERAKAITVLRGAGQQLDDKHRLNPVWAPWAGYLAIAVAPDDPKEAQALAELMVERARTFGTPSAIGVALRMQAAVADSTRVVDLLTESVGWLTQSPAAYELAFALIDLGAALCRVGRLPDAAEQLYQGMELAQSCGADGLVQRAWQELAASGLRPNLRTVSKEALSQREWEVAELAVKGVPAQRIADRLGVTLSLVHQRLAAVYRKTGTGPAGLAVALGLPADEWEKQD